MQSLVWLDFQHYLDSLGAWGHTKVLHCSHFYIWCLEHSYLISQFLSICMSHFSCAVLHLVTVRAVKGQSLQHVSHALLQTFSLALLCV